MGMEFYQYTTLNSEKQYRKIGTPFLPIQLHISYFTFINEGHDSQYFDLYNISSLSNLFHKYNIIQICIQMVIINWVVSTNDLKAIINTNCYLIIALDI